MRTLASVLALGAIAAFAAAGCGDRTHLSPSYGRAFRQSFSGQIVDHQAGTKPHAVAGLDPQEAGIIVKTYRRDLAPKQTTSGADQPIIFVAPPQRGAGPTLPPSVPAYPGGH